MAWRYTYKRHVQVGVQEHSDELCIKKNAPEAVTVLDYNCSLITTPIVAT